MTYRRSFLLSSESSFLMNGIESLKETQIKMTEANAVSKPISNGISGHEGTGTTIITSVYFMKKEVERLKESLKQTRASNSVDLTLKDVTSDISPTSQSSPVNSLKTRKSLKEDHKIMSFDWSPDQRHIVCGAENGAAYIWDGFTGQKEIVVQTPCKFVLSCTYSPSATFIGCCGLNKTCSLYSIDKKKSIVATPKKEVGHHDNYMSNCSFFGSDHQLITTGENGEVAMWDVDIEDPLQSFTGHTDIVTGLAVNKLNPFSMFATCGDDCSVYLWDARTPTGDCVHRVEDISSEVTQVRFFPNGDVIGYTTANGETFLYDLKASKVVQTFSKSTILFGASSLDFSKSGRVLFVGYNDTTLRAWDTLKGEMLSVWYDHEERISNVLMSGDGMALGTSSWDGTVKIWA